MIILDFGKNKGLAVSECDEKYLKWLITHEKVLAERNRWACRNAKVLLAKRAEAKAQAEAVVKFEAEREARMAVKAAEQIVRANQGSAQGSLNVNRGFSLMR